MRKTLTFLILILLIMSHFAVDARAHATYTGYSSAPGSRGQCAYDCHPQRDFTPTVTVTGFPATYIPNQQYIVAVAHQGGSSIMNFNASVRIGTGSSNAGTISSGTNTSTYNVSQETNGVHFTSTGQNMGDFTWTAPAAGAGAVRLYWAGLQGNLSTGADTQIVLVSNEGILQDHAPEIAPIAEQNVAEGSQLAVRVTAIDQDGDPIALSAQQLPANAFFADSSGGIGGLIFNPDFTQAGLYHVRIIALANSLADTQMIDITVSNFDRPPVLADIPSQAVQEGGHLEVWVNASDPDGDPVTLAAFQLPPNAAFMDSSNGVGILTFDPDTSQAGTYHILIVANSNSLADSQQLDIEVSEQSSGCSYISGDINGNHQVNGIDIVYGVNYLKGTGAAPPVDCGGICPESSPFYAAGDVNGNCAFNGIDITFFVRFLKGQVPSLLSCSDCPSLR